MKHNILEILIGAIVLGLTALSLGFVYSNSQITSSVYTQKAIAQFDRIDGIVVGSDVRISGVKVGTIAGIKLHPESFRAIMTIQYDSHLKLPADSVAEISSSGLLGNKYVALKPGADDELLKDGAEIIHTQSAINLEAMIGHAIFSSKSGA